MKETILTHVARYRLTTIDIVHCLFYPNKTRDAAQKSLRRHVQNNELESFEIKKRKFFYLRGKAIKGSQSLTERYAVLNFCCARLPRRVRITPDEFKRFYPELAKEKGVKSAQQQYCFEDGSDCLFRLLVDGNATPDRVVRKCIEYYRTAMLIRPLSKLIERDLFSFTVLTTEPSKADAIEQALFKQTNQSFFKIAVVDELKHIL